MKSIYDPTESIAHSFVTYLLDKKRMPKEQILDILGEGRPIKGIKELWADKYEEILADPKEARKFFSESYKYLQKYAPGHVVTARTGINYKNCTTQVNLPPELADTVIKWGLANVPEPAIHVDEDDPSSSGREDDIHCTLLYGITDDNPETIAKAVLSTGVGPFRLRLGLVTAFMDKPGYDVLKIDAEAPEMTRLHYGLRNILPNVNKFPMYEGHVTVAYMNKGIIEPLLGNATFRGMEFPVNAITFVDRAQKRTQISLGSGRLAPVSAPIKQIADKIQIT